MPSPEQYANAIECLEDDEGLYSLTPDLAAHYTLALRCLRVVAAMEAGKLELERFHDSDLNVPVWRATIRPPAPDRHPAQTAPDPLTAAERAMGVGNG